MFFQRQPPRYVPTLTEEVISAADAAQDDTSKNMPVVPSDLEAEATQAPPSPSGIEGVGDSFECAPNVEARAHACFDADWQLHLRDQMQSLVERHMQEMVAALQQEMKTLVDHSVQQALDRLGQSR